MANAKPDTTRRTDYRKGGLASDWPITARFYKNEKPALVLSMSRAGNDGLLFVQNGGAYTKMLKIIWLHVMVSSDDYLRIPAPGIIRTKTMGSRCENNILSADIKGYNVVAKFPEQHPVLKDEIVMLGGHLDSWQGATGATIMQRVVRMMEAVRIIAAGLQPNIPIRIALWSGEQGTAGFEGLCLKIISPILRMDGIEPEHAKLAAYYNLDNGTGKYVAFICRAMQQRDPSSPNGWNLSCTPVQKATINNTGGTDHQALMPWAFPAQFIQDEIEYDTRTAIIPIWIRHHLVPKTWCRHPPLLQHLGSHKYGTGRWKDPT